MNHIPHIEASDLMLARLVPRAFSREGWIFELMYDGFRCLVLKDGDDVTLLSRQGNPLTPSFPDIVEATAAVRGSFVWDAELTVDDADGRPSLARLLKRANTRPPENIGAAVRDHPARLYIFDMLAEGMNDLRQLPLSERKAHRRDSFENSGTLVNVRGIVAAGEWVFDQVEDLCFEGMVSKRLESTYRRGYSSDWLKVKNADFDRPGALGFGRS